MNYSEYEVAGLPGWISCMANFEDLKDKDYESFEGYESPESSAV